MIIYGGIDVHIDALILYTVKSQQSPRMLVSGSHLARQQQYRSSGQ